MPKTTILVEHDGMKYEGQIGTIKSTSLGYEDHGILTASLDVRGEGWGLGGGGFCLDEPKERGSYSSDRRGTAYGLDHIIRLMETVGVDRWEKLPGQQIIVLYEGHAGWGGRAIGLAGTTNDKVLILQKHADAWREAVSA